MSSSQNSRDRHAESNVETLRVPPHNIHAEQSLIGAVMLDNAAYDHVCNLVGAQDFYRREHRLLWGIVETLIARTEPVDPLTVCNAAEAAGQLEAVGGRAYIATLYGDTATAKNAAAYARIVRSNAALRALYAACTEGADRAINPGLNDPQALAGEIEEAVSRAVERPAQEGPRHIRVFLAQAIAEIDRRMQGESDVMLPTGLSDLDRELGGGMEPEDLILVAGRPGMGKTAFAMTAADHAAITVGLPVAVFSLEMSGQQMTNRALARLSGVPLGKIRSGQMTDAELTHVVDASKALSGVRLLIDDTALVGPNDLRAQCRKLRRQHGPLGLIVIDYLQLMQAERKSEHRSAELSVISRALKLLAKEQGCPVMALSQLNRACELRQNKRPMLADLRESGALEQDADTVLFLYRDEAYNADTRDKGVAEVIVGKQRNGAPGAIVKTAYIGHLTKFANLARQYDALEDL